MNKHIYSVYKKLWLHVSLQLSYPRGRSIKLKGFVTGLRCQFLKTFLFCPYLRHESETNILMLLIPKRIFWFLCSFESYLFHVRFSKFCQSGKLTRGSISGGSWRTVSAMREFKKLQRQLQRKRHIKIELCFKLSLLRLFRVDHVV